jgi:hypothetical protein
MKILRFLLFIALVQAGMLQAQTTWQTTHTTDWHSNGNCKLESNSIRMILHPFHIDVEEEAAITAIGSVSSGDPATLEITGQFELSPGSALRSMLLWNVKILLKAKLKDRNSADSVYETVVDRNKPVVVRRDPAIISKIGDNMYQFKIYPVAINNSRKIRILYSVPLLATNLGPRFAIKTAFTYGCSEFPNTIPVEFIKPVYTPFQFIFEHGTIKKTLEAGATYLIPYADFISYSTDWWGNPAESGSALLHLTPDSTSFNRAYSYKVDSTNAKGYYSVIFSKFPDTLAAMIKELSLTDYTIEAKVVAGDKTYLSDIPYIGCFGVYIKSTSAWDCNVYWNVYTKDGAIATKFTQRITSDTASIFCKYLPLFWGAKYTLSEKTGNFGALFGFVDGTMSLLALERDSLKSTEALAWQAAGVPPLLPNEIIIKADDMPVLPVENVIFEYSPVVTALPDATKAFSITMLGNNRVAIEFGKKPEGRVSIALVNLSGRLVYQLDNVAVSGHSVTLSLPAGLKGVYLMRVAAGKQQYQKKLVLK